MEEYLPLIVLGALIFLIFMGAVYMIFKLYRKVDQGRALIINKISAEPEVTFTGGLVIPVIHRAEQMDISVKTIEIDRRGHEGLICADNIRADIKVTFFVRVNKTKDDVLKVAQAIGCDRASDQRTLEELFNAKFSEALKTVGKRLEFEQLYTRREDFKDQIIEVIGRDLNGYVLDDAAIDYLEQTPLSKMDPQNILDAQGIRKITEMTAAQNVKTNELRQKERMELGSQNLNADEAVFRFDQQRAEAEARKNKEIAVAQTRESQEAARVASDESKKTMLVKQANDAEIGKAEQDKLRTITIAEKARQRELAVEEERVTKAREMERIARERTVDLQTIEKQKAIEIERKAIADVVRERVAVDRTVAEQEEAIKKLRVVEEARRMKEATIIQAEATAEEKKLLKVKLAEAGHEEARLDAKKKLLMAEAQLEASDKEAQARIRLAEGRQAESAADGMAKVRVAEAEAVAIEKQGMAKVRVEEAEAGAIEKRGAAENKVMHERHRIDAEHVEVDGLAHAKVKEADAAAVEKQGIAHAISIEKRLEAEAKGLEYKARIMESMAAGGKEHEEFRMSLEKNKEVQLANIAAQQKMAEFQAQVLAQAFTNAKFNIVGGDGEFFERFINAVGRGQALDGMIENSEALQGATKGYRDGSRDFATDLKDVLTRPALSADGVQKLTVSAVLTHLLANAGDDEQDKLTKLIESAKRLGLD
ncbi:MAG: hypothetical protein H6713_24590 [Myxococcales bacterium]|nr:hypothetical protein [Myxococcales bacterium]